MNKFFKIFGVILIVVGAILASFTSVAIASYSGIAVSALGLALTIIGVWKNAEKKGWKEVVTIICFALGGFLCGFAGITENTMSQLILAISGVAVLIISLLTALKKD